MTKRSTPALALFALVSCFVSCSTPEPEPSTETTAVAEDAPSVRGKAPRASGGFPSVILLVPQNVLDLPVPPVQELPALMDQHGNAFHPRILVVRHGQPVEFRNSEDVLHNVHVFETESRETVFNVGTPVVGSYRYTFERPGAYDVSCDIHPAMAAFIIVSTTPYVSIADSQGSFAIRDVPAGSYALTVWNLDPGRRIQRQVEVGPGTTELNLLPD